jgi:hypothetical protein
MWFLDIQSDGQKFSLEITGEKWEATWLGIRLSIGYLAC